MFLFSFIINRKRACHYLSPFVQMLQTGKLIITEFIHTVAKGEELRVKVPAGLVSALSLTGLDVVSSREEEHYVLLWQESRSAPFHSAFLYEC